MAAPIEVRAFGEVRAQFRARGRQRPVDARSRRCARVRVPCSSGIVLRRSAANLGDHRSAVPHAGSRPSGIHMRCTGTCNGPHLFHTRCTVSRVGVTASGENGRPRVVATFGHHLAHRNALLCQHPGTRERCDVGQQRSRDGQGGRQGDPRLDQRRHRPAAQQLGRRHQQHALRPRPRAKTSRTRSRSSTSPTSTRFPRSAASCTSMPERWTSCSPTTSWPASSATRPGTSNAVTSWRTRTRKASSTFCSRSVRCSRRSSTASARSWKPGAVAKIEREDEYQADKYGLMLMTRVGLRSRRDGLVHASPRRVRRRARFADRQVFRGSSRDAQTRRGAGRLSATRSDGAHQRAAAGRRRSTTRTRPATRSPRASSRPCSRPTPPTRSRSTISARPSSRSAPTREGTQNLTLAAAAGSPETKTLAEAQIKALRDGEAPLDLLHVDLQPLRDQLAAARQTQAQTAAAVQTRRDSGHRQLDAIDRARTSRSPTACPTSRSCASGRARGWTPC